MRPLSLVMLALPVLLTPAAAQGTRDIPLLTPEQRSAVEQGKTIQVLQPVASSPWPRSVVFQFIDASPEQCAAVLADYALQSTYIPRMRSSRILARQGANETDVEYLIDIPLFPDEKSVSRQRVRSNALGYSIEWHTIFPGGDSSGSVTSGTATFMAMAGGRPSHAGTLMVHDQTVIPSSVFAKVPYVRNKGIESSRAAAVAIAKQVERERRQQPALLERQIAQLRAALASTTDSGKVTPGFHQER